MMRRIHWMGLAAAALLLASPASTLAKHGADDTIPEPGEPGEPEPEKTGHQLAKHGADDTIPEPGEPDPEPETPGIA